MPKFYFKVYEVHRSVRAVEADDAKVAKSKLEEGDYEENSFDYIGSVEDVGQDCKDDLIPPEDYRKFDIDPTDEKPEKTS